MTTTLTRDSGRYGFLTSPRWIALFAVAVVLVATMVGLGFWQLSRYQQRTAINEQIDAAGRIEPKPVTDVLEVGKPPPQRHAWTRVTATGTYDPAHEILIRGRTVNGAVGYEVLTPLVLDNGAAVLVDRGWVPPGESGAAALPEVPEPPSGEVTVIGRVHLPESSGDQPAPLSGRQQARRIDPARLASAVGHDVYGGYLLVQRQDPSNDSRFVTIPIQYEDNGQNLSYMIQWWLFSVIVLAGMWFLIRREARQRAAG